MLGEERGVFLQGHAAIRIGVTRDAFRGRILAARGNGPAGVAAGRHPHLGPVLVLAGGAVVGDRAEVVPPRDQLVVRPDVDDAGPSPGIRPHQHDPVAPPREVRVVRHQDRRGVLIPGLRNRTVEHDRPHARVERAERVVEDEYAGVLVVQRPCQGDAGALSSA